MLDLVVDTIDAGKNAQAPLLSEQHFFGEMLRDDNDYAEHFYEIPQQWLNAYYAPEGSGEWTPQLHVHLVNKLKTKYSFRPFVQASRNVYNMAATLARTQGDRGPGLAHLPQHGKTAANAREWWSRAKGGITHVRFLDEDRSKIVDYMGEVLES